MTPLSRKILKKIMQIATFKAVLARRINKRNNLHKDGVNFPRNLLILRAKTALNVAICMIFFNIFVDNGVMNTPKRRILSLVFTIYFHIEKCAFL